MKLLYTVIFLFGVIQLARTNPLKSNTTSSNTLPPEKQLVNDYDKKFNLLAQEICVELKHFSEQILQDQTVQRAATPFMEKFKRNITHFQQIYPVYVRTTFNQTLVSTFSNMISGYYYLEPDVNKEALYIQQLIRKLGYDEIRNKYKNKFNQFMSEEFLPKYEKLKVELDKQPRLTNFEINLLKWVDHLKKCGEYECYLNTFNKSNATPKERFFGYIQRQTIDMIALYLHNAITFVKDILKDTRLSQLSPDFKKKLEAVLKLYIEEYEQSDTISQIEELISIFLKYSFIEPLKDLQLLTTILDDHGFGQALSDYNNSYDEFLKHDLIEECERLRASLSQEEMRSEKYLLAAIDRLKDSNTLEEREEAFQRLQALDKRSEKLPI